MVARFKNHFDNKFIDEITGEIERNYFTPILNHVLRSIEPKKICDIGCGNGIFSAGIKKKINCNLTGIDANEYALSKAKDLGFDKLIQISDFNHDSIPVKTESIDLVICKDVLEHLVDPLHLTKEIARLLKPNGMALIHVPNHFPVWGRLKFLFTNNIDTFNYFPDSERFNFPHIRFFTTSSINKLLNESGLESKENLSYYFVQPKFIHRFIPLTLKKVISKISTNNFSEGFTYLVFKR